MRFHRTPLIALTATTLGALTLAAIQQDPVARTRRAVLQDADRMVQDALTNLAGNVDECDFVASLATTATIVNHRADLALAIASCINEETGDVREYLECLEEAFDEFNEGVEEAHEQHAARLDLCQATGGGPYDPDLDEDEFLDGVFHPYLPYLTGAVWVYEVQTDEGLEEITVTVLDETRWVDDIECIVVRDTVTLEGELIEDTLDWYAQHEDGTVWYMGEISQNFEDGELDNLEGSWETGIDGALPGIVMPGTPRPGITYRQELLLTEAEDAGTMLDTNVEVTIGIGTFTGCLQTADFTPIEPDALEHKFYAPGIGLILETKPGSTERLELVSFTPGS